MATASSPAEAHPHSARPLQERDGVTETNSKSREQRLLVPADTTGGDGTELRALLDTEEDLASLLESLQDHHWRIRKADVQICLRQDGTDAVLAQGSYGKVYRGILNNSLTVAIKALTHPDPPSRVAFVEEIVCLMNLRHANIVSFFGAVIDRRSLLLITEFMPRGSLYSAIATDTERRLGWHQRGRRIAQDVARAVAYMHARGATHQDLKSKNVLLCKDWQAKLCDLGLCCLPKVNEGRQSVGTLEYAAPEVLNGSSSAATEAADIYSVGVILGEIASGNPPDRRSIDLRIPEDCPEEVARLIEQCTDSDPAARPTAEQVFSLLSGRKPPPTRPIGDEDL